MKITRAYPLSLTKANRQKIDRLESELFPLWNTLLTIAKQNLIAKLKRGEYGRLIKADRIIPYPPVFNARTIKAAENQVYSAFQPWLALSVIEGRKIITALKQNGEISEERAKELYTVNKYKRWWEKEPWLAVEILKVHRWPNFAYTRTITIYDGFNGRVVEAKNAKHDLWLEMKVQDGSYLALPVEKTAFFDRSTANGTLRNAYILTFKDGEIVLRQAVDLPVEEVERTGEVLALDWGLNSLFTTDSGEQFGRWLYPWLREQDEKLVKLTAELQRLGVKPRSSKRYRKLHNSISSAVKNEVGRILNKIDSRGVSALTVESLDFRGGGLSKGMNRILSRAGRGAVSQKLKDLAERGVDIQEVNPAYTSQQCSSCGFVAKENRTGKKFQCLFCGRRVNADFNGAVNIGRRRSVADDGYRYWSLTAVRRELDTSFTSRWGIAPAEFSSRHSRPHNGATGQGSPHRLTDRSTNMVHTI